MDSANNQKLSCLIERGGIHHHLTGRNPEKILECFTGRLPVCPGLDAGVLLKAAIEREALMSTGIGKGIALPHPRTPVLGESDEPFIALGFLSEPVDWNTPDGSKVHTVFLIVSSSAKQHLNTLSKINFLCQQEKFYTLIKAQASKEEIMQAILEAEAAWV